MSRPRRSPPAADLARRNVLESIRAIVGSLRQSARSIERHTGATNAQVFLLQQLVETPGLGVGDLAERARTSQSTVSLVIKRIEAKGLVRKQRSLDDARKVILKLTPAGRRLVERAPKPPTALLIAAVEALRPSQLRELSSGLTALVHALGLETDTPPMLFEHSAPRRR